MRPSLDSKLKRLMLDYGYVYKAGALYTQRIAWYSARLVGHFDSAFKAAEYLCPIIKQDSYTKDFVRFTTPTKEGE